MNENDSDLVRWFKGDLIGRAMALGLLLALVPIILWGWRGVLVDLVVLAVAYGVLRFLERPRPPR